MGGNYEGQAKASEKGRLSFPLKIGYAIGVIPESIIYNMFYSYFVIFLTNIAMVTPMAAGTIALIALIWDCLVYPIVGYKSDTAKDKRKFIWNFIPMALTFIALFITVGFSDTGKFIYYLVIACIFWLFYTLYIIPYYALVPEISNDYDERTQIRGISAWFNSFAIYVGAGLPMVIVGMFMKGGISGANSWLLTAVALCVVVLIFGTIVLLSLNRIKLVNTNVSAVSTQKANIGKAYWQIAKLKPAKYIIIFALLYTLVSSLLSANLSYLIIYRVVADASNIMLVLLVTVITMIVFVPIGVWFSGKTDRKVAIIVSFFITIVAGIIIKLIGITSLPVLFALAVFTGISTSVFWSVIYPMAYDLVEVDEFVNGVRREGVALAFVALINKLGSAFGLWIMGAILTWIGYNAKLETQTASTLAGIENISTIIPAAFLFLSILAIIGYPISKKAYQALQLELEKKRKGEVYSTENISRIV